MQRSFHRLVTGLIVGVVVLSAVPVGALAQGVPGNLMLNQGTTEVGTVTVDGQQYQVYRYDNALPYASGISVYADGEQVRSAERVRVVVTALAERRAVDTLGAEEVDRLRTVRRQARVLANASARAAASLNATVTLATSLKADRLDGTTAWNASRRHAPHLVSFNETAAEVLPELRATERYARAVVTNSTALIDLVQARRNGTDVDPHRLYDRYMDTLRSIARLSGQEFDIDTLAEVSRVSARIAGNISDVPEQGPALAAQFTRVNETTTSAANRTTTAFERLDEAAGYGSVLEQAETVAQSQQSQMMGSWKDRRYAPRDIYGTLLAIPVGLVAVAGYLRWRR